MTNVKRPIRIIFILDSIIIKLAVFKGMVGIRGFKFHGLHDIKKFQCVIFDGDVRNVFEIHVLYIRSSFFSSQKQLVCFFSYVIIKQQLVAKVIVKSPVSIAVNAEGKCRVSIRNEIKSPCFPYSVHAYMM